MPFPDDMHNRVAHLRTSDYNLRSSEITNEDLLGSAVHVCIHPRRFSSVPVLVVKDSFTEEDIAAIEDVPGVIIANTEILEAPAFTERLVSILAGSGILPPLTGSLVKHAIAVLNRRLSKPISRWQIAESVNISEDYLTRIFRREMGLSPWDYLTRCRVGVASDLLRRTGAPLSEIAQASGFQDQAYFNRVFRRIKGCTPGHYRQSV